MDISQRTTSIAGLVMILAAIATLISVGLTAAGTSDKSPFERDEVAEFLTDVNDNEGLLVAAGGVGIVNDGIFLPIIGAALFLLFRDRNPFLATITLVGVTIAAGLSLIVDISNVLLTVVAADFVEGGPSGVGAGDPAALELGRYLGMVTFAFVNTLFTPVGTAFVALGLLLIGAPQGRFNPPKWIGGIAIIGGLSSWLAWLVLASDALFVFFPIQLISTLVLLIALGIWLIRHGDLEPAPMNA